MGMNEKCVHQVSCRYMCVWGCYVNCVAGHFLSLSQSHDLVKFYRDTLRNLIWVEICLLLALWACTCMGLLCELHCWALSVSLCRMIRCNFFIYLGVRCVIWYG